MQTPHTEYISCHDTGREYRAALHDGATGKIIVQAYSTASARGACEAVIEKIHGRECVRSLRPASETEIVSFRRHCRQNQTLDRSYFVFTPSGKKPQIFWDATKCGFLANATPIGLRAAHGFWNDPARAEWSLPAAAEMKRILARKTA
jgi:hypothetical protein